MVAMGELIRRRHTTVVGMDMLMIIQDMDIVMTIMRMSGKVNEKTEKLEVANVRGIVNFKTFWKLLETFQSQIGGLLFIFTGIHSLSMVKKVTWLKFVIKLCSVLCLK